MELIWGLASTNIDYKEFLCGNNLGNLFFSVFSIFCGICLMMDDTCIINGAYNSISEYLFIQIKVIHEHMKK